MIRTMPSAVLLLAAAPFLAAQAEPRPASQDPAVWLERCAAMSGQPVEFDLIQEAAGPEGRRTARGHVSMGDRDHFRATMQMEMTHKAVSQPMRVNVTMVADGRWIWSEAQEPASGGRQVMRISLEKSRKQMAEAQAAGRGAAPIHGGEMDFVEQVKSLLTLAEFEVKSAAGGKVVLLGLLNEKGREVFDDPAMGETRVDRIHLTLDEKSGFPLELRFGSASADAMTVKLSNLRFPGKADLSQYTYTPPEGATVIDLDQT